MKIQINHHYVLPYLIGLYGHDPVLWPEDRADLHPWREKLVRHHCPVLYGSSLASVLDTAEALTGLRQRIVKKGDYTPGDTVSLFYDGLLLGEGKISTSIPIRIEKYKMLFPGPDGSWADWGVATANNVSQMEGYPHLTALLEDYETRRKLPFEGCLLRW